MLNNVKSNFSFNEMKGGVMNGPLKFLTARKI